MFNELFAAAQHGLFAGFDAHRRPLPVIIPASELGRQGGRITREVTGPNRVISHIQKSVLFTKDPPNHGLCVISSFMP